MRTTIRVKKTFIIAEAGVNHNGQLELAQQMIDCAVLAGVDAVKFQTFTSEALVMPFAPQAQYQRQNTASSQSQLELLKKLELDKTAQHRLYEYCRQKGIIFLSSPFALDSVNFLIELGLNTFKIPSGEITNLPYLRKIGSLKKDIILSTGMCDLNDIKAALDILIPAGTSKDQITVLHCNTEYPTPFEDVNLLAMLNIRDTFQIKVGYSDHTLGIEVAVAAAALGATVIEKHFTLDRNLPGPDHRASLEPQELAAMVHSIRNIDRALGERLKKPSPSEIKNRDIVRKSIVASRSIRKGELLSDENLTTKRPALGISPMVWDQFIGTHAKRDFQKDEFIE